jgi:tRNA(Ile)-lysidine synthase
MDTYCAGVRRRLCQTAALVTADYEVLSGLGDEAWERVVESGAAKDTLVLNSGMWRSLPTAFQRSTVRRAVLELRPGLRDLGFVHVEGARRVAIEGTTGARATLPAGVTMTVGYGSLIFAGGPPTELADGEPCVVHQGSMELEVPGMTELPGSGWSVAADLLEWWDVATIRQNVNRWTAYLDYDRLGEPLVIRRRRPGDVFMPQGMDGHRTKVSTLMINRKIPRASRDGVPLVEAGDTIVWICGHQLADGAGVGGDTRRVLCLSFRRASCEQGGRRTSIRDRSKESGHA